MASLAWRFTARSASRKRRHGLCFSAFALLSVIVALVSQRNSVDREVKSKQTRHSSAELPRTCIKTAERGSTNKADSMAAKLLYKESSTAKYAKSALT